MVVPSFYNMLSFEESLGVKACLLPETSYVVDIEQLF